MFIQSIMRIMKHMNSFNLKILLILFTVLFINGCGFNKSNHEKILGNWNAHWETKPEESLPEMKLENLNMDGQIIFEKDGKVTITAYGFEGCIFSSDTLVNTLNWKLEDTVLRFIDSGDQQGLPYAIKKFTNQELHLLLLDDIKLNLSRN